MQTAAKLKPQIAPRKQAKKHSSKELRVVKSKNRFFLPDAAALFSVFLISSILLAVGLIFNVSQRALIAQVALENKRLEDQFEKEQIRREKLMIGKVELNSSERIEKIAVEKLGMVNSTEINYLELPSEIETGKKAPKATASRVLKRRAAWDVAKDRFAKQMSLSSLSGLNLH